jgi:myo-inositol-1(or 4)-monophosphatase
MANKPLDTTLLDRAIVFAVRAHAGTERRGKGFPYIVHPMEAVEIVATMRSQKKLKSFGIPNEYETYERFYCGY